MVPSLNWQRRWLFDNEQPWLQSGFTDEELDYIINYDIKYRMGKDLMEAGE
ncbi:MAG: hypothetical protein K9M54_01850 [Kiritimatiellales bacterium]|nr:hypothetical protein [Kiritimatiellales bacterium]